MRRPLKDANAGAAMEVSPTKKHATRTAEIAKTHGNKAQQRAMEINQASSQLGQALGKFMEEERQTELEKRYLEAFHKQGAAKGLSEYQKDLKRSGFTEFIYGGQSPEYQGALDASARNATNAMYLEEAQFIEGEGADMTPDDYYARVGERVRAYTEENFADAPDAAIAFMKSWQKHSNELSRQQVKNFAVRQQEKARATVAEGFQTDFDVYKTLVDQNPDLAYEHGQAMFTGKYKPAGMSDEAYQQVLVEESFTAIRRGDYAALQLFNQSGLKETLDDKGLKEYRTVQGIIDTNNFNMLEAARLDYEQVVENPASSGGDVRAAKSRMDAAIQQIAARDTGSTKHMKTVFGADRHRTVIGNQWRKRIEDSVKKRQAAFNKAEKAAAAKEAELIALSKSRFEVDLANASAEDKLEVAANRLDELTAARTIEGLDADTETKLNKEYTLLKNKYDGWKAKMEKDAQDAEDKATKLEQEEQQRLDAVQSLNDGKGYISSNASEKKKTINAAVKGAVDSILPQGEGSDMERLTEVLGSPSGVFSFVNKTAPYVNYVTDSSDVTTAIQNMSVNLRSRFTEDNAWTEEQIRQANALKVLEEQMPQLYVAAFDADRRLEIAAIQQGIDAKAGVAETTRELDNVVRGGDRKPSYKMPAKKVVDTLGLHGDRELADAVYTEYSKFVGALGHDRALAKARTVANASSTKVDGYTIHNGSSFGNVEGMNIQEAVQTLQKTYKTGGVTKVGLHDVLSQVVGKSTDANGRELHSLKQVPGIKVSVYNGGLIFELNGRIRGMPRDQIEVELNGYKEWREFGESGRPKGFFDGLFGD